VEFGNYTRDVTSPAGIADILTFEGFELDLRAEQLTRHGIVVNLPPRQFTVLVTLVTAGGALVTRDQLRERLWSDDAYVDFNAGMNFSIRQLRLSLGDTAGDPRFIQTEPRRGHRFLAKVETARSPAGHVDREPDRRSRSMMSGMAASRRNTGTSGRSASSVAPCGAFLSSTMIVMMMAITPSLKASSRFLPIWGLADGLIIPLSSRLPQGGWGA